LHFFVSILILGTESKTGEEKKKSGSEYEGKMFSKSFGIFEAYYCG